MTGGTGHSDRSSELPNGRILGQRENFVSQTTLGSFTIVYGAMAIILFCQCNSPFPLERLSTVISSCVILLEWSIWSRNRSIYIFQPIRVRLNHESFITRRSGEYLKVIFPKQDNWSCAPSMA